MSVDPQDVPQSPEPAVPPASADDTQAPAPEHAIPHEPRLSRRAAWLAMGSVVLALLLVWLAPGLNDEHIDPADAALVGRPAPLGFTLKDMNGVDVKLESFRGKVILLNFWATWCGPCVTEIPWRAPGPAGRVRPAFRHPCLGLRRSQRHDRAPPLGYCQPGADGGLDQATAVV